MKRLHTVNLKKKENFHAFVSKAFRSANLRLLRLWLRCYQANIKTSRDGRSARRPRDQLRKFCYSY
jgi:hypothetical protein